MIYEILEKIQTELKCNKGQYNNFGNYKYRSCEDICEALKPLLKEYKCSVTLADEIVLIGERYYIRATATLHLGDEKIITTAWARESQEKKGMDASQITGATSSYARKYALNGLFLLDDTEDADSPKSKMNENKPKDTEIKKQTQEQFMIINSLDTTLKDFAKKKFNISSMAELNYEQAQYIIDSLKAKGKL